MRYINRQLPKRIIANVVSHFQFLDIRKQFLKHTTTGELLQKYALGTTHNIMAKTEAPAKEAEAQKPAPVAQPEPQSEKLTALKAELNDKWAKMVKLPAGSKEALDANLDVYKQQKLIDAEIANIRKAEADLKVAELRNARVAMMDNYDKATGDDKAKLREAIVNELLAKYAHSTPAKVATDGSTGGSKGATSAAIKEILLSEIAGGATVTDAKKAAEAKGYSRGTTGAVATAMIKAGEISA